MVTNGSSKTTASRSLRTDTDTVSSRNRSLITDSDHILTARIDSNLVTNGNALHIGFRFITDSNTVRTTNGFLSDSNGCTAVGICILTNRNTTGVQCISVRTDSDIIIPIT